MVARRLLLVALAAVFVAGLLAMVPGLGGVALGVLLIVLPGYAVTAAVLPSRALRLSDWVTVVLSMGVALLALGGILLTSLPAGLSFETWAGYFALLVAGGLLVAVLRRQPLLPRRAVGLPSLTSVAPFILALAIAGGAFAVARSGAYDQDRQLAFTEFWAVSSDDRPVRIGVTSHEKAPTQYRVEVELDGRPIGGWETVELAPGDTWGRELDRAVPAGGILQADLYRRGDTSPYRRVTLHGPTAP